MGRGSAGPGALGGLPMPVVHLSCKSARGQPPGALQPTRPAAPGPCSPSCSAGCEGPGTAPSPRGHNQPLRLSASTNSFRPRDPPPAAR
eukprot:CAMPEP_0206237658 /NCGR_PEP_ID=MMETSP0047_2-20121206/14385_1 /ASSEMBLY_ACC=CAM_ASM_000192 /TAXON_ID=195065 /ORGANISM="Chroomonas mesostigmatica_cf, Strain CCMP1168" /LENGTH=88 /DNA_ID=CAMNT_0053662113 /DNA_START=125 /DNA_END=388 /DNA_ORIENTATION=+